MSTRNIIIAAMVVLVVALFLYLLTSTGTKPRSDAVVERSPVTVSTGQATSAGDINPLDEAEAKLQELQAQQGPALAAGLSRLYIVKCAACHGRDGRGPIGPSIAGKTYEENRAILMKYKMKQVPNSAMLGLLEQTSDEELEMLAREISVF